MNGNQKHTNHLLKGAAITQLTGGSTKYIITMQAELAKPKKFQPGSWTVSMDKCHLSSAPMPEIQWLSL